MKIISKEIIPRKEISKQSNTTLPKNKGLSKSLSKPIKHPDFIGSPPRKGKQSDLKVIKEVVKKKNK